MADTAYHNEALRKARVIERKKAAEMSRGNVPSDGPECFSTYHPDPRRRDMESLGGVKGSKSKDQVRQAVAKDLWRRDRTLRNSNMYMGHVSSFTD